MDLKWISPQSRFLMKTLFKRNFDNMTIEAQKNMNTMVLLADIVAIIGLWYLL